MDYKTGWKRGSGGIGMKNLVLTDESDLVRKGMDILVKELGPVESAHFICLFKGKRTDSVKRHRAWQKSVDKEKFFDEVFGEKSERFEKESQRKPRRRAIPPPQSCF